MIFNVFVRLQTTVRAFSMNAVSFLLVIKPTTVVSYARCYGLSPLGGWVNKANRRGLKTDPWGTPVEAEVVWRAWRIL